MKKSLSLILALTMVFTMFASVAFAADPATTTAPAATVTGTTYTPQQAFDALVKAGIVVGDDVKGANLDANLTRAEFSKILANVFELKEDTAGSTVYSDLVGATWAEGYIGAATKAGLLNGMGGGKFNPSGNLKLEEIATVIAKAFKLDTSVAYAGTGKVDKWAKGYVGAVIAKGLVADAQDFTKAAKRSEIFVISLKGYTVYQSTKVPAVTPAPTPAKVSVTSAKATGAKLVTVSFDKAVDTAKAVVSLKRGSIAVATTTKFADDKKSAVLTLTSTVISDSDYTATLSGLDAADINTASASFKGEKETVTKIEFVNANETLPYTAKVIVTLKATNQYGEAASASSGSYDVFAGSNNDVYNSIKKDDVTGLLLLSLKTNVESSPGVAKYPAGLGIIPVFVVNKDTHVSVTKNFKMGTTPFVSKIEISPLTYSNGKNYLGGQGENATFNILQSDQYGNLIPYDSVADPANIRFILNGYEPNFNTPVAGDTNNDDIADMKLSLSQNVDKDADYNFSVFNQGGSTSGKISVKSSKTVNKIEILDATSQIAAGDADAYLTVVGYDAAGNQLSTDDLVNLQNVNRLNFTTSGVGSYHFETIGEHKGQLRVLGLPGTSRSVISVTASLKNTINAQSFSTKIITIGDARVPERFAVDTDAKQKIVENATNDFKFLVYDQYGQKLDNSQNVDGSGNIGSTTSYTVTTTTYAAVGGQIALTNQSDGAILATYTGGQLSTFNGGFRFKAGTSLPTGDYRTFTATLTKTDAHGTQEIAKVTRRIDATKDTLTYSAGTVSDLFNAIDSSAVTDVTYGSGTLLASTQESATASAFKKEVTLSAIDAAGNTVAIPNTIQQLTSSNILVAQTGVIGGQAWVVGNKKGTATLNVTFTTSKGVQQLKTLTVNTKDDVITTTKISWNDATHALHVAGLTNAFDGLNVTDNYGITYEDATAKRYNYLFGVTFTVSNIGGTGNVSIDQYGNITKGLGVTSYELTATTAAGFSASTFVN